MFITSQRYETLTYIHIQCMYVQYVYICMCVYTVHMYICVYWTYTYVCRLCSVMNYIQLVFESEC